MIRNRGISGFQLTSIMAKRPGIVSKLHMSLAVRLFGGQVSPRLTALGATGNALSIAAFVLTLAGAALAWRVPRLRNPKT